MKPVEIIIKAKKILLRRGWCKGVMNTQDGRVCLLQALTSACGVEEDSYESKSLIQAKAAITKPQGYDTHNVGGFNDRCSDLDQVIRAMDLAVANLSES